VITDIDARDRDEGDRYGQGVHARRSALSVPGSSERMLEKAAGLDADEIVVDLEDSVAPEDKERARGQVVAFLTTRAPAAQAVAVRINALAGPWGGRDVVELVRHAGRSIDSLIVPKTERAEDLAELQRLLELEGERAHHIRLQALVETAAGLLHVGEIAVASPRLDSLILGYADLAASLGRATAAMAPESWIYAQETLLVAARAAGVQGIDGPYLEIRDHAGLRLRAEHVRALGFDGKWAVHPDQLPIINTAFTPTAEQISRARAVLDALSLADGRGAVELHGEMIDEASRKHALQVLARGGAAGSKGARR
jgi:citrate lyase subunit beta/citryl-CoA lyase